MDAKTELKENMNNIKVDLNNSISSLEKCITDYKVERKSEWKLFKSKINEELHEVEKSLKKLTALHKM
jgi:ElaB/YqjD/DUF883 family membrane-anchored ribosome-binding protein